MIDAPLSHRWFAYVASSVVVFGGALIDDRHSVRELATLQLQQSPREALIVTDAWARPALKDGTGGAYMTLRNSGAVALRVTRASSNDASAVELHESTMHDGMAHMQMMPSLEIAPGASTTFKPGGLHYMLIGLRRRLIVRDTVRMVLRVESVPQAAVANGSALNARDITVLVPVRVP